MIGAHGLFFNGISMLLMVPFIYNTMRFNGSFLDRHCPQEREIPTHPLYDAEIMFEEAASLLAEKRPMIEPRQSRSELVNEAIFPEVGGNLSMDDRRALARSMEAYEEAILHPGDVNDVVHALGVPVTPRVVLSAAVAVVSALATTGFRLLYS